MNIKKSLASLLTATLISSTYSLGGEREQNFKISTTNSYGEFTPLILFDMRSGVMDWTMEIGRETQVKFTNSENRVKINYDLDVFKQGERDRYIFPIEGTIIFVATEKFTPKAVNVTSLKSFRETEDEKEKAIIEAKIGSLEGKKLYALPLEEIIKEPKNIRDSFELQIEKPYIIDCRFFGPRGVRYIIEQK